MSKIVRTTLCCLGILLSSQLLGYKEGEISLSKHRAILLKELEIVRGQMRDTYRQATEWPGLDEAILKNRIALFGQLLDSLKAQLNRLKQQQSQ